MLERVLLDERVMKGDTTEGVYSQYAFLSVEACRNACHYIQYLVLVSK